MTTFIDYAWWQVSPAQLKAMGFSGVMRYISHDGSKDITAVEIANLRAAGFDIGIVFESTGSRSAEGFGAGHDDAIFANQRLDALGYPANCLVTYAVDFDAAPSQVQPYFDGVASVVGRPSAPYGGIRVVDGVRYPAPFAWQTEAWSGGRVSARAGLLQDGFHSTYDSNQVLIADFGQWRARPTPPPQEEDDVAFVISTDGEAGQYLISGGLVLALDDSESNSAFQAAGAKPVKVSAAEYTRIEALAK